MQSFNATERPLVERTLTELDYARLQKLNGQLTAELADCLEQADLVPPRDIAGDVVTMYSQVETVDPATGQHGKVVVCYPADAEPAEGFVSALSPLGASLLGLRVGDVAHWRSPTGEERATKIAALLFQPEASGDFTT
jgi:regulator of nucleoside diphosphate kinase